MTVSEILGDELMAVAAENWRRDSAAMAKGIFKPKLVGVNLLPNLESIHGGQHGWLV